MAAPSAQRPDGAMARFWPRSQPTRRHDCVHYCLPGVVDAWSTLFYNLVASERVQRAMPPPPTAASDPALRRFVLANATAWLHERGYAERFEACRGRLGPSSCEPRLQAQPWWAFDCWESRDRAKNLGKNHAERWTPWMPAESFDR